MTTGRRIFGMAAAGLVFVVLAVTMLAGPAGAQTSQTSQEVITGMFAALSGADKTPELLARFIDSPALLEHIRQIEASYPRYELDVEQMMAEGEIVAVHAIARWHGVSRVEIRFIALYQVANGRVVDFWLPSDLSPEAVEQPDLADERGVFRLY